MKKFKKKAFHFKVDFEDQDREFLRTFLGSIVNNDTNKTVVHLASEVMVVTHIQYSMWHMIEIREKQLNQKKVIFLCGILLF